MAVTILADSIGLSFGTGRDPIPKNVALYEKAYHKYIQIEREQLGRR